MLKRGGTKLQTVPNHTIHIECACGHTAGVTVAALIVRLGAAATVADAVGRVRCSRCGAKSVKTYRLTYAGGSYDAMLGAAT
jgi:hypothetical protein